MKVTAYFSWKSNISAPDISQAEANRLAEGVRDYDSVREAMDRINGDAAQNLFPFYAAFNENGHLLFTSES